METVFRKRLIVLCDIIINTHCKKSQSASPKIWIAKRNTETTHVKGVSSVGVTEKSPYSRRS